MSEQKMTVASLAAKTADQIACMESMIADLTAQLHGAQQRIAELDGKYAVCKAALLELRNVPKSAPAKAAVKPTEAKQDENGVYTFIPANCNVTAVSTKTREAVKLDGQVVKCTPRVWAYWRTILERQQKASARETSQYEEYCA